jgi:hypothetical protein
MLTTNSKLAWLKDRFESPIAVLAADSEFMFLPKKESRAKKQHSSKSYSKRDRISLYQAV